MKRLVLTFTALVMFSVSVFGSQPVVAQNTSDQRDIVQDLNISDDIPRNSAADPNNNTTIQDILDQVYAAAGVTALLFIMIGGIRYIISDGNDQRIKQSKDTITYSIVGLVAVFVAFAITRFVLGVIIGS